MVLVDHHFYDRRQAVHQEDLLPVICHRTPQPFHANQQGCRIPLSSLFLHRHQICRGPLISHLRRYRRLHVLLVPFPPHRYRVLGTTMSRVEHSLKHSLMLGRLPDRLQCEPGRHILMCYLREMYRRVRTHRPRWDRLPVPRSRTRRVRKMLLVPAG